MKLSFYKCKHCGNVIVFAHNSNVPVICCGEKMTELVPNTVDGSVEKHLPVYKFEDNQIQIKVGSVAHPMDEDHHIEFIAIETENGYQFKSLKGWKEAIAKFNIPEDRNVKSIYEYCNKHGLWKTDVK